MARTAFALGCACVLISVAGGGGIGSAAATGDGATHGRISWRAVEDRVLGPEYVAEHAKFRSAQRDAAPHWRRLNPAERRAHSASRALGVARAHPHHARSW